MKCSIVTKQNKPSNLTPISLSLSLSLSVKINLVCLFLRRLLVRFAYLSCISCKSAGDNITHVTDLPVLRGLSCLALLEVCTQTNCYFQAILLHMSARQFVQNALSS